MAWTAPRTWTDGELVTKAIMDPHVRDNLKSTMHAEARKTADQIVNNSTTFVNDTHLSFAVAANEVWVMTFYLRVVTNATADIKFEWTYPSGTASVGGVWPSTTLTLTDLSMAASASPLTALSMGVASSTDVLVVIPLHFINGVTAGTFQLRWAQNTANVSDTKLLTGSCIIAARVT